MERTIPIMLPIDETFDIGSDTGTPVDDKDYQVPFAFSGKIDKLTIALDPPKLTSEDVQNWRPRTALRRTRTDIVHIALDVGDVLLMGQ